MRTDHADDKSLSPYKKSTQHTVVQAVVSAFVCGSRQYPLGNLVWYVTPLIPNLVYCNTDY